MMTTRIALPHKRSTPALRVSTRNASIVLGEPTDLRPKPGVGSLVPVATLQVRPAEVPMLPAQRSHRPRSLRQLTSLPEERRFPLTLDLSRKEVRLPFGVGRFINAATLRAIAGGSPFGQLLRKTGSTWVLVEDHTMIDLTDASKQFRLGRLTIFS